MNKSLEALETISKELYLILPKNIRENLINTIKQDLELLEKLKIADKNNQNLIKTNVDLVNKNLELQKDNNSLQGLLDTTKADYINIRLENEELEKENQELKQDVKDVLEDYKDAALRMFKYAEVIDILQEHPEVLTDGLDCFKWSEDIGEYEYVKAVWIDTLDYDWDDELIETKDLIYEFYYLPKEKYELLEEALNE